MKELESEIEPKNDGRDAGGEDANALRDLRHINASLTAQLSDFEDAYEAKLRSKNNEMERMKVELEELRGVVGVLHAEREELKGLVVNLEREVEEKHEKEEKPKEVSSPELDTLLTQLSKLSMQTTHLSTQNARLNSSLESYKRRAEQAEKMRLEEQEKRLGAESLSSGIRSELEKEHERRRALEEQVAQFGGEAARSSDSGESLKELTTLRSEHATLLDRYGQARQELVGLKREVDELRLAGPDPATLAVPQPGLGESQKRDATRISLLEREIKFLKDLVTSFERERERDDIGGSTSVDQERISQLEALLEEYKTLFSDNERLQKGMLPSYFPV